jgi:hypothetical protein
MLQNPMKIKNNALSGTATSISTTFCRLVQPQLTVQVVKNRKQPTVALNGIYFYRLDKHHPDKDAFLKDIEPYTSAP